MGVSEHGQSRVRSDASADRKVRESWRLGATLSALVALTLLSNRAFAEPNGFDGAFQDDVPIVLPPFHGIDPKLSLHYNSSSGNGPLGVGWSLSGLSVIERVSPGRGCPEVRRKRRLPAGWAGARALRLRKYQSELHHGRNALDQDRELQPDCLRRNVLDHHPTGRH